MPIVERAGFQTRLMEEGKGGRSALFLHCTLGHSGAWAPVMRAFEDDLRMVAMDLPGHGGSADWDPSLDLQDQAVAMAIAVLEQMETPAALVGHSFGGTVAMWIAVERPELVRSLVLVEPVAFSLLQEAGFVGFEDHVAAHSDYLKLIDEGDLEGAAQKFTSDWGTFEPWASLSAGQREYLVPRMPLICACDPAIFGRNPKHANLAALSKVNVPTLLVCGGASQLVMPALQDALATAMPHAEKLTVPEAGHMLPITHSKALIDGMRAFWF